MDGRENIGTLKDEPLIADATFPADVVTVTLEQTEKIENLERGTVLAANANTGKCKAIRAVSSTASFAAYVLAEAAKTSTTEDVVGVAYQTGKFVEQSLKTSGSYELAQGDLKAMRDGGIYVEKAMM